MTMLIPASRYSLRSSTVNLAVGGVCLGNMHELVIFSSRSIFRPRGLGGRSAPPSSVITMRAPPTTAATAPPILLGR